MANSAITFFGHLQHAKQPDFGVALMEFLDTTHAPDGVVEIVAKRLDDGTYILDDHLVALILRSRSSTLYSKVRDQLRKNPWAMLQLYEGGYPDPEIESQLCDTLFKIAPNDAEPLRRNIVKVLGDVGSEKALPTLNAILFDLEPGAKLLEMFSGAFDSSRLDSIKVKSRSEFVKIVAQAIDAIEDRVPSARNTIESTSIQTSLAMQVDVLENAARYGDQAKRYSVADPVAAITYIRLGAEALSKELYRRLGHEKNGKPARKLMLDELLKHVKDSPLPEPFKILIQIFQLFGNFAAHDQDDQWKHVTKEMASAMCKLYGEAFLIYSQWIEEPNRPSTNDTSS